MMIPIKNQKYIKVFCIKTNIVKDAVWGDCTIYEGTWYEAVDESDQANNYGNEFYLIKIRSGLVPYEITNFKTEAELRDEKINKLFDEDK